jgi:HEAT repeat protein
MEKDIFDKSLSKLVDEVRPYGGSLELRGVHDYSNVRWAADQILDAVGEREFVPTLLKLLQNEDADVRRGAAVIVLALEARENIIPAVMEWLRDEDKKARRVAAEALGWLNAQEAIPELVALLEDEDSTLSTVAAWALGALGTCETIPTVVEWLRNDNITVRWIAAETIARLDPQGTISRARWWRHQGIPTLIELLRDENANVRQAAARALGRSNSENVIPALIDLLEDKDAIVRQAAIEALEHLGTQKAIPNLVKLVGDENINVRGNAAWALGRLGTEEAVQALKELLDDENTKAYHTARRALQWLDMSKGGLTPVKILGDEETSVRKAAIGVRKDPGIQEAIPVLEWLQSEDPNARQEAVGALGSLDAQEALPALVESLVDEDENVRKVAIDIFKEFDVEKSIPILIELLRDKNAGRRQGAAKALGELGAIEAFRARIKFGEDITYLADEQLSAKKSIPALLKLSSDEDASVRQAAIVALGKLDAKEAIPVLMELLQDENAVIRESSALSLGKLGVQEAIPILVRLLGDENADTREAAVIAMGEFRVHEAIPSLQVLLRDDNDNVKQAALKVLVELDPQTTLSTLIQLLKDEDATVRQSAMSLLGYDKEEDSFPTVRSPIREFGTHEVISALIQLLATVWNSKKNGTHEGALVLARLLEQMGYISAQYRVSRSVGVESYSSYARRPPRYLNTKIQNYHPLVRLVATAWALKEPTTQKVTSNQMHLVASVWDLTRSAASFRFFRSANRAEVLKWMIKYWTIIWLLRRPQWIQDATLTLMRLLGNGYSLLRGTIGRPKRVDTVDWLRDADAKARQVVIKTLERPDIQIAIQSLMELLRDKDTDVRQAAVQIIGWLDVQDAVPVLKRLLDDEAAKVRFAAAEALGVLGATEAVPDLVALLQNQDDADVRWVAAWALDQLDAYWTILPKPLRLDYEDEAVQAILALLWDENPRIRLIAAWALGTLVPPVRYVIYRATRPYKESEPPPRFADFTFYYTKGNKLAEKVSDGYVLQAEQWYQLEVAIRVKPTGIPEWERRGPIREPKQEKPVIIMITAEGNGFEIKESVQTLTLPPLGDSINNALFQIRPLHQSTNHNDLAEIRVRLYYEFNLLEVVIIRTEVIGKFDNSTESRLGLEKPISFRQERLEREYIDLDNIQPRVMHVDVTKRGDHFLFNFAFYNAVDQQLVFTAPTRLIATDLEDDLVNIRKIWYEIVMNKPFIERLEGDEDEFRTSMRMLAKIGHRLWIKLFKQERNSSIYKIGTWLEEHPLEQGGIIQISLHEDATNFVFPWALIHDRPMPEKDYELPDLEGFWGVRYCIEQRLPGTHKGTDEPIRIEDELKIKFMLWDQFRYADEQRSLMKQLRSQSKGKIVVGAAINDANACYELLRNCDGQILYFYTHGYTRHRQADLGVGSNLDLFLHQYEHLSKNSPLHEIYGFLYKSIKQKKFEPDRSWIELTYGKLYLDELYEYIGNLKSEPLVILNMCESAQITPSLSDSFIHFFLDRGSVGVIGTECPMTVEFAHPFAEKLLLNILRGEQVGTSMLNVRRHFMRLKNPLGLAYTLFGSATTCYEPPPIGSDTE